MHAFYYVPAMNLTVETEREEDGRWVAEVPKTTTGISRGMSTIGRTTRSFMPISAN